MKPIVIVGPTGVGKTKLSIELAKLYNGEIINADSTQIYKELNIGTAKIKLSEMGNIVHHLIDIMDPTAEYSVFDFQKSARILIDDIINRGKTPIIVGGTGLYTKALIYDYKFIKEKVEFDYNLYNDGDLYDMLLKLDPEAKNHRNNRIRTIRALEYFKNNGTSISTNKTETLLYDVHLIGLNAKRELLYEKLNERVDNMIFSGLLNESLSLYSKYPNSSKIRLIIGYSEIFEYLDKSITLEKSIGKIKQNTRNYAKKQITWFNNQMNVNWFDVNYEEFNKTTKKVIEYLKQQ